MKLADWRNEQGVSQEWVAVRLGRDAATVWRWEAGQRKPSEADMEAIFLLTEGKVEPNDFYDVPAWRRVLASMLHRLGVAA